MSLSLFGASAVIASPAPTDLPGAQISQPTADSGGVPVVPIPTAPTGATAPVSTSPMAFGSKGAMVRSLQHRLRARGITIPITGTYDAHTRAGVRILQRTLKLPATGTADVALLQRIGVKVRGIAGSGGVPVVLPDPAPNAAAVPVAMSLLGIPYRYGGSSPATGFDCSGFLMYVYAQIGKKVPHQTVEIWNGFPHVPMDQLAIGDIILSEGLGHAGMYIGGGKYIHSPRTGDVVKVSDLADRAGRIEGAVRP